MDKLDAFVDLSALRTQNVAKRIWPRILPMGMWIRGTLSPFRSSTYIAVTERDRSPRGDGRYEIYFDGSSLERNTGVRTRVWVRHVEKLVRDLEARDGPRPAKRFPLYIQIRLDNPTQEEMVEYLRSNRVVIRAEPGVFLISSSALLYILRTYTLWSGRKLKDVERRRQRDPRWDINIRNLMEVFMKNVGLEWEDFARAPVLEEEGLDTLCKELAVGETPKKTKIPEEMLSDLEIAAKRLEESLEEIRQRIQTVRQREKERSLEEMNRWIDEQAKNQNISRQQVMRNAISMAMEIEQTALV